MADEFLSYGDRVMICGRNAGDVTQATADLKSNHKDGVIFGCECDVRDALSVQQLAEAATEKMGRIDIWVNNAGMIQKGKTSIDATDIEDIRRVVETNLLGTIYGSRAAISAMKAQSPPGGHIFNVDGRGSRGDRTPNSIAYGVSKAGIPQLTTSLAAEAKDSNVGCHVISPGMVTTDLLMSGNRNNKKALHIINILAEKPETSASWLVPRIRGAAAVPGKSSKSEYIRYLTPPGVVWRFATFPWRRDRLIKVN